MGIQGLLPLLKDIQVKTSISSYSGQTVGIDAYCWLHKGAYGPCANDLAQNIPNKAYVNYVMRRIDMMISHNVTPILVFDGGHLPAKAETEKSRRTKRKQHRERAMAALKEGNTKEAYENFQRCVNITPEMASEVIQECYSSNVQCIVAPYEADAQLAYLMKAGITQLTISEDSDLLLYGCNKVMYKMAIDGEGLVIDLANLSNVRTVQLSSFTEEKFRHMCMLSGCDYLPSIKGMGLMKAFKSLRRFSSVFQCIKSLKCDRAYSVPQSYEENFRKADLVFKYQLVFDIRTKTLVRLNEVNDLDEFGVNERKFAGPSLDDGKGLQIALGNIDPISERILANRKEFASGDISQKSNSWDSPAPNKNTAFQFHDNSQQSSPHFTQRNNSTPKEPIEDVINQSSDASCKIEANKSLKRLQEDEVAFPTREEKIRKLYDDVVAFPTREEKVRKLYGDDVVVECKDVSDETKSIATPNNKLNSASRHNVFSHKSHTFKNPFKQVNDKPSNQKVVSRFFDNRVVDAKENTTVLQVETPEVVISSCVTSIESAAKTIKHEGSFLDYLDHTNLRGYEVKVLKLSPEKPKQKQIQKVCPKKKRTNMFSLFKKENDNSVSKSSLPKNESQSPNIDFNVTIPLDDGSNKDNMKKEKSNMFSHFEHKVNNIPEEHLKSDLTDENVGIVIDDENNNIGDEVLQSEVDHIDVEIVNDLNTKSNISESKTVKQACEDNKRKSLKLGLSRNSKGLSSWSDKLSNFNFKTKCDSYESHSGKSSHILQSPFDCVEENIHTDLLLNLEENDEKVVSNSDDEIIDLDEKETLHTEQDDLLFASGNDQYVRNNKPLELNEEPLPSHLENGKMSQSSNSMDEELNVPKTVEVIYLDDEEPLPFHLKGNKIDQVKSKSLSSKIPSKQCKPIGLRGRKRKSLPKSTSDDNLKQMTFEKFAYQKKSAESTNDILCLS